MSTRTPVSLGDEPAALLESLGSVHTPPVVARMRACGVRFVPGLRGSLEATRDALTRVGCPASEPILAFEARYGGMIAPRTAGGDGTIEAPVLRFGPFSCLGAPRAPDAYFPSTAFAPAVFTWDDVVYLLDDGGRAFARSLDDLEQPFAPNGAALVARVFLYDALGQLRALDDGAATHFFDVPGQRAPELAQALGVPALPDASADDARFFGDGDVLVVDEVAHGPSCYDEPLTLVAAAEPARLHALRASLRRG